MFDKWERDLGVRNEASSTTCIWVNEEEEENDPKRSRRVVIRTPRAETETKSKYIFKCVISRNTADASKKQL